jgi:hypothetical protein
MVFLDHQRMASRNGGRSRRVGMETYDSMNRMHKTRLDPDICPGYAIRIRCPAPT